MKLALIPILFFTLFSGHVALSQSGNSIEVSNETPPRFPMTFGQITYKVTGDAEGSARLIFDRHGWRSKETKELTIERYGLKSKEMRMEMRDGDYVYKVDLLGKAGKKSIDKNLRNLLQYKSQQEAYQAVAESKSGVMSGQDTILQLVCNKWVFSRGTTSTLWEYEGIPLKIERSFPGLVYIQEATAVDSTTNIPKNTLDLPSDIIWK